MYDLIENFIKKAPFAAVLWQLKEVDGKEDFYMISYNSMADELDRRNFSLFLGQPFKSSFPEAPELRDSFFKALQKGERINFDEFEHWALRKESYLFRIWIIPLDSTHVLIMYQKIAKDVKES